MTPAAEAENDRLRTENDRLRGLLAPFIAYAEQHPYLDGAEGEIGEFYSPAFRVSISYRDLRAVRDFAREERAAALRLAGEKGAETAPAVPAQAVCRVPPNCPPKLGRVRVTRRGRRGHPVTGAAPLGQTTAAILTWLAKHGPATALEIGRAQNIDGRSMRGRLVMLARQGFVEVRQIGAKPVRPTYGITAEGRQRAGLGDAQRTIST